MTDLPAEIELVTNVSGRGFNQVLAMHGLTKGKVLKVTRWLDNNHPCVVTDAGEEVWIKKREWKAARIS